MPRYAPSGTPMKNASSAAARPIVRLSGRPRAMSSVTVKSL